MNTLYTYLAREGITQEKFADMLGVSQSLVSKYRSGTRTPSLATALKISRLTDGQVPVECWSRSDAASPKTDTTCAQMQVAECDGAPQTVRIVTPEHST